MPRLFGAGSHVSWWQGSRNDLGSSVPSWGEGTGGSLEGGEDRRVVRLEHGSAGD